MDFGDRIKYLREYNGFDQMYVCDRLKIEQSTLSNYENNRRTPKFDLVSKFAELYNVSIDYLFGRAEEQKDVANIEQKKKGVRIPVLGYIRAGIPIEAITDIIDYEDISAEMAAGGEYFGLRVKGDSMVPVLLEGDTIIVRQQPEVENGETAIVSINGDEATVKRVKRNEDGSIMLIPNNPAYETMYFTREQVMTLPVKVLGKVVEIRRKL